MEPVVPDPGTLHKFETAKFPVTVCDATGVVVGRFLPENVYQYLLIEDQEFAKPIDEETRRQGLEDYAAGRCVTTEELLKELEDLERGWGKTP